jgi:hypothetical protein
MLLSTFHEALLIGGAYDGDKVVLDEERGWNVITMQHEPGYYLLPYHEDLPEIDPDQAFVTLMPRRARIELSEWGTV